MRSDGDLPLLRPEGFLPDSDGISARRKVLNAIRAVWLRDSEVGIVQDANPRVHPAMDVAFYGDHDFGLRKLARDRRVSCALAVIPLAVELGHGVDVVRDRIGVRDFKDLAGLNAENSGLEPAAILVDLNGSGGSFESLALEPGFHIDERVGHHSIGRYDERLVHCAAFMRFDASRLVAHVDFFWSRPRADVANGSRDRSGGRRVYVKRRYDGFLRMVPWRRGLACLWRAANGHPDDE